MTGDANELKALKLQVEKIVRPVRALASRKLRMRRELLAHLQNAVEEERERGIDLEAAVQGAIVRLGDEEALRAQLQRSVPWVERMVFSHVPLPGWYERWEVRSAVRMESNGMTLGQTAAVLGMAFMTVVVAMLLGAPVLFTQRHQMLAVMAAEPLRWALVNVIAGAVSMVLLGVCLKLMGRWIRQAGAGAAGLAAVAVGLLWAWIGLISNVLARQPLTAGEVVMALLAAGMLVVLLAVEAKAVAMWRRPYREWLELDVAG